MKKKCIEIYENIKNFYLNLPDIETILLKKNYLYTHWCRRQAKLI